MNNKLNTAFFVLLVFALASCASGENEVFEGGKKAENVKLFEHLDPSQTGISFNNEIVENERYNHVLQDVIFNGGGIAVIDINNDGLQDLYFAGNQVSDQLYLNEGNMKFRDITESAGISNKTWSNAVAIADVNNDGFDDIYVGKYMRLSETERENELYINNGDNTFTEKAAEYGLNDAGHCTAVNFFDYDKDGLLDVYVGNQPFVEREIKYSGMEANVDRTKYTDRLYHNTGNGTFEDVTHAAGITNYNYTLSATVSDMNNDGWLDVYVASDYEEPDYMYQNNGDGTFTNVANVALRHMSNFSMGVDIADFNNDGFMDFYVADMVAADNYRLKANMSGMNPQKFWDLANSGFHYQYMFNMLQMNNGNGFYSEIGHLSGVSNTDWSWATLFADYDNDGDKDLMVTNGLVKEVKNKDYIIRRAEIMDSLYADAKARGVIDPRIPAIDIANMAPSVKLHNYIYSNQGDLTFRDQVVDWGFEKETWSNGAVYSDLDNDGDLDLVISNMNDIADVYENKASDMKLNNYLQIRLEGDKGNNRKSYGAKVKVYTGEDMQVQEMSPTRGYLSSCEALLHFGVGANKSVDRVEVEWLDGRSMVVRDVAVNQQLLLKQSEAAPGAVEEETAPDPVFAELDRRELGIDLTYTENEFDDYAREVLLPHRMSTLGPCMAKGDINGDGREEFFVGGAAGKSANIFMQLEDGNFVRGVGGPWTEGNDINCEDVNALFFDADGDGDQDLYVVSGGNEFSGGDARYQDRLYINNGQGSFSKSNVLPDMPTSGGVVAAGDMDGDGDLDLFVGGRQMPGEYGFTPRSYVLRNEGGTFTDVTTEFAPDLYEPGMVTDADWFDFEGDGDLDLLVIGEWMPLGFYQNEGDKLRNVTSEINMQNTGGWWNRAEVADMDGDGDLDIIAGNLGYNIKFKASEEEPFRLFTKDFDGNGTHDVYLAYYDQDGVCYPVRGRQCSSQQMPYIKSEFKSYHEFATATVNDVLGPRMEGATQLEVQQFATCYIENLGGGEFEVRTLPNEAQISPTYGIVIEDFNNDGIKDVFLAGNYYEREVETCRSDAGVGQILIHDGKGNFEALHPTETGVIAIGDVRSVQLLNRGEMDPVLLIANNNSFIQSYALKGRNM
ncbi:MAG: VCBS repeat-containing protein [Bacteroidetes bacterium]|nr:VCBS repeat-containing protein [Bacteroidota bacterium]